MNHFRSATLKLTGWYLGILMTVCLLFSGIIYGTTAQEFDRPLPPNNQLRMLGSNSTDIFQQIREERAAEAKRTVLLNLVALNLLTLAIGAATSYVFAKRTLQPIEDAMEAQARFTSDASHELRTPLAVIRTEAEIALRDKKPSVNSLKNVVTSSLEEVERLQQLTDRLLALSNTQQLELTEFTVGEVVHASALHFTTAAKQKDITLRIKAKDLPAYGNPDTIGDILAILIDNAIKHSPEGTAVTIASKQQGNHTHITVTDQGAGIPEDALEHIFDRFYRADQSRSKQHVEGHGLGLALARRLAEQNGATLTATNNKTRGATFALALPRPKNAT